jgi:Suppressor of fused protein (SUFU)
LKCGKIAMTKRVSKLFAKMSSKAPTTPASASPKESSEEMVRWREWYDYKSGLMERMLGKAHDTVMHAIIAYVAGGPLDSYYYPNGIPGTAIATKELSDLPNEGSQNRTFSCYELVMFTRQTLNIDEALNNETAFGKAHRKIASILNVIARYSTEASLNPGETCEFPADVGSVSGKCMIFDSAGQHSDERVKCFGLLTVIEVFRSEMNFAREHGCGLLIEKLKAAGHYPYSDMDREPVA